MSIEFRNVTFGYTKEIGVLKDFNLKIEDGQMVSIIGHNGSGKSTIAKLIVGLVEANSGSVLIDGVELSPENIDEYRLKMG
ncbi:MAG: ATP-binding cassette domain-containing protein, partial [Acholeplasmataceae bacterium]|nr:ATP-binding cassette domain-containing protein [Acholeplasmataceae bacterium]